MNYEKELMLLMGPIGSGKTTFANSLKTGMSIRISQDDMGRKGHRRAFSEAVSEGIPRIIVDRMNFNRQQRERYRSEARDNGYCVTIFELDTTPSVCYRRVVDRKNHPTIKNMDNELIHKIILSYYQEYEAPEPDEYDNHNLVETGK